MTDLIAKKGGQAFFNHDELAKREGSPIEIGSLLISIVRGGAWITGDLSLTATALIFDTSGLKKVFQPGKFRVEIPLADIRQMTVIKPLIGFKIIRLTTAAGDFKISTRNAQEFADLIEKAKG